MKIDSEYLDIDILPELMNQTGITKNGVNFEIFESGNIYFENGECASVQLDTSTLEEIVRVAKLFKNQRIFYLANKT